jgi:hypothetical protein
MLDIWKVNLLYSMGREFEHTGLKTGKALGIGFSMHKF